MDFGIAVECDEPSASVSQCAAQLSDAVQSSLICRDYGEGLNHIYVGLLMLPTHSEGHERRKFKFEKQCLVRSPFGPTEMLNDVASVDATVDPQLLEGRLLHEQRQVLARAVLSAVDEIGEHREIFPHVQFDVLRHDIKVAMETQE